MVIIWYLDEATIIIIIIIIIITKLSLKRSVNGIIKINILSYFLINKEKLTHGIEY